MATEIERKFLVLSPEWRTASGAPGRLMRQGYLAGGPPFTVRVRIAEPEAWLTIKGPVHGISRAEYEYPIPLADALAILASEGVGAIVEKIRHRIPHHDLTIEVDEFLDANAGLILAEVELPAADTPFHPPAWLGKEVTHEWRYHNSHLARQPYTTWTH